MVRPSPRISSELRGPTASGQYETTSWRHRGGFAGYVAQILEEWEHQRYDVVRVDGEGDWVNAYIHLVSKHRATGGTVDIVMSHAMRFSDGKIVEFHEHVDPARLMAAAGR